MKGKTNLGIPIQSWEVNQATRWSKCDLAWIGRSKGAKRANLVLTNLKGEITDSLPLPAGLENHKLIVLGQGKFMFLDLHLLDASLSYIIVERSDETWVWKSRKKIIIPLEISGLYAYLTQARNTTEEEAKAPGQEFIFSLQQIFFAADKLFIIFKKAPVQQANQNAEKQRREWFLFDFDWNDISFDFRYLQTIRLYFADQTNQAEDCGTWQFQPALSSRNEKQILFKQGARMPVWYKIESGTMSPAIQIKKPQHHFVVTSALVPDDLHCLAWKVGSTFLPGLDNKAVKSDKPVVVGAETIKIKETYLAEKPRSIEQDSMLDAVFLAEGENNNLWMLPASNWCQQSGGASGVFEFNHPILVYCQ